MYGLRKTDGYVPKKNRHDYDKDHKLAIATIAKENLAIPNEIEIPLLPNSLEAWTKKTQVCATEAPHVKQESDRIEKLKQKLKESNEKAEKLEIQNEDMMEQID